MTLRKSRIVTRVAFAFVEQFGCSRHRERKRERKIVRTLSNQDAMQCNALVRLLNWVKGDCMAYLILDLHKAS